MPEIIFPSRFLKMNVNTKHGDKIKFLDAGKLDDETERYTFNVAIIRDGVQIDTKEFNLNKTNYNAVLPLYGNNSDAWVGKEMEVNLIKTRNPQTGGMVDSVLLTAPTPPVV